MKGDRVARSRRCRSCALPFRLADDLEIGDRNKAAGIGDQRVACLVPICVVFSADDMEKVALGETEFLGVARVRVIVIERFDDLGDVKESVWPGYLVLCH